MEDKDLIIIYRETDFTEIEKQFNIEIINLHIEEGNKYFLLYKNLDNHIASFIEILSEDDLINLDKILLAIKLNDNLSNDKNDSNKLKI